MKILIPYDGSDSARDAIADLARAGLPKEVQATILSVADVWLPPSRDVTGNLPESTAVAHARSKGLALLEEARRLAEEGEELARSQFPRWTLTREAVADSPAWAAIKRSGAADLVVIGARGQSPISRFLFGSVSQKVIFESDCSVRIGRKRRRDEGPIRIVAGIDGSLDSAAALLEITSREWPPGTEVRVLTSIDANIATAAAIPGAPITNWLHDGDQDETKWISRMLDDARAKVSQPSVEVSTKMIEGDPKVALIEEADSWEADAIFVGARGHSLMERLMLGSVSSAVAARAHCSVEIIRRRTAAS